MVHALSLYIYIMCVFLKSMAVGVETAEFQFHLLPRRCAQVVSEGCLEKVQWQALSLVRLTVQHSLLAGMEFERLGGVQLLQHVLRTPVAACGKMIMEVGTIVTFASLSLYLPSPLSSYLPLSPYLSLPLPLSTSLSFFFPLFFFSLIHFLHCFSSLQSSCQLYFKVQS